MPISDYSSDLKIQVTNKTLQKYVMEVIHVRDSSDMRTGREKVNDIFGWPLKYICKGRGPGWFMGSFTYDVSNRGGYIYRVISEGL